MNGFVGNYLVCMVEIFIYCMCLSFIYQNPHLQLLGKIDDCLEKYYPDHKENKYDGCVKPLNQDQNKVRV
jgi:hypothetical protein